MLIIVYRDAASIFGLAHLFAEAIFVGGLGCIEWINRDSLVTQTQASVSSENVRLHN